MEHYKIVLIRVMLSMLTILWMGSCEELVLVDLPETHLTGKAVFDNEITATAALMDVYSSVRDQGILTGGQNGVAFLLAAYSDEMNLYGVEINNNGFYEHQVLPTNRNVLNWWKNSYNQIYSLNMILEKVTASKGFPQKDKDRLIGESLFLRSLLYFHMANIWGDIPFITTTDYHLNSKVTRDDREWVLEQLAMDLDKAISLLPEEYPSNHRTRANRYTAMALQARLALYAGQWEQVEFLATNILKASTLYQWEERLDNVFKIESPTTIWQLQTGASGRNTWEASAFVINTVPPTIAAMNNSLYSSFEVGDLRLVHWIGRITDENNGVSYYYPYKYQAPVQGDTTLEYSKMFRIAEIYLIRAEANVHLGKLSAALADLNLIRLRAGLVSLSSSDPILILNAIVEERRHELFTEHGHRWFDLKRLGLAKEALSSIKDGWKDTDILFPVPEAELISNPNLLPQNKGY